MERENPPRLNVEITEKQDEALRRLIPWGLKHHLFSAIVDELIELLNEHGELAITMITCKKIKFLSMLKAKEK
ncbi:MAG: hypothetical protein QMD92_00080 [bacterium]|nr:hypothetical protein [bacterium]